MRKPPDIRGTASLLEEDLPSGRPRQSGYTSSIFRARDNLRHYILVTFESVVNHREGRNGQFVE